MPFGRVLDSETFGFFTRCAMVGVLDEDIGTAESRKASLYRGIIILLSSDHDYYSNDRLGDLLSKKVCPWVGFNGHELQCSDERVAPPLLCSEDLYNRFELLLVTLVVLRVPVGVR